MAASFDLPVVSQPQSMPPAPKVFEFRPHPFPSPLTRQLISELDAELVSMYPEPEHQERAPLMASNYANSVGPKQLTQKDREAINHKLGNDVVFLVAFGPLSTSPSPHEGSNAEDEDNAVGCIAIKPVHVFPDYSPTAKVAELKRMYVRPKFRKWGLGERLLLEAEREAKEKMSVDVLVLETGLRQGPAMKLYERNGWTKRPVFGVYAGAGAEDGGMSVCYEKMLR